ncbi:MAG: amidohydrolase family protein [Desulfohalobiaceae bacterium]|nr:amidohydrolase family protein [Desulfohalobiaceae bacterium]
MRGLRCKHILTMQEDRPLLEDGMLLLQGNRVADVGPYRELKNDCPGPVEDLGPEILAPGLINAHTHLEFSHLRGRTAQGRGFVDWVLSLLQLPMAEVDEASLEEAVSGLRECGTSCIADVTGHSPEKINRFLQQTEMEYALFKEALGFQPARDIQEIWSPFPDPEEDPRLSLSGHALYSTHPRTLQLCKTWSQGEKRPFSIHLAESPEEVDLITTGKGGLADLLLGTLLPEDYVPPGVSPIPYADQLNLLDQDTLAIHCVQIEDKDIEILRERGTTVCLCPRSNAFINVGVPPWRALRAAGVPLCLGTDSLGSNTDLNLWGELISLLEQSPEAIPLQEAVEMVTVNPARILGRYPELGTLQPGSMASTSLVPREVRHQVT